MERFDQLMYWIVERHNIFLRKEAGETPPWTNDPELNNYRYCNPYRENDKVTRWIFTNWLYPHRNHKDLWFAMVIARLLNNPNSLQELGYPTEWNEEYFIHRLNSIKKTQKIFNAAYIVSTNGVSMDKVEYLAKRALGPLWAAREYIRPREDDTLLTFFSRLNKYDGMGSFMSGQVIADVKHGQMKDAEDWWTFAVPGPGSLRGMRRLHGLDADDKSEDKHWQDSLWHLRDAVNDSTPDDFPEFDAQNIQNTLCEFDKFMRLKLGEGKPKQKYLAR